MLIIWIVMVCLIGYLMINVYLMVNGDPHD